MSLISVNNLTFGYDGSYNNIFEDVSFNVNFKLRNAQSFFNALKIDTNNMILNMVIEYYHAIIANNEKLKADDWKLQIKKQEWKEFYNIVINELKKINIQECRYESCEEIIIEYFENEVKLKKENFGNGRLVRNLVEKIKFEQAVRIKEKGSDDLYTIIPQDIKNVVDKIKTVENKRNLLLTNKISRNFIQLKTHIFLYKKSAKTLKQAN